MNTNNVKDNLFLLLQINDSLFPIGGYSHSFGLETYIQKKIVFNRETAKLYIQRYLFGSFLYTELLSAFLAYDYATEEDYERLINLDNTIRAIKAPREIREASEKLGSRFIKTINSMNLILPKDVFSNYVKISENTILPNNHCVVYGILCACAEINKKQSLINYLYSSTSAMVTNLVKTVPLSQMVGQEILADLYTLFQLILEKLYTLDESELGLSNPGFEIRSMEHETLYSRLYMS